LSWKEKEENC
jgi:hypothetical protein